MPVTDIGPLAHFGEYLTICFGLLLIYGRLGRIADALERKD